MTTKTLVLLASLSVLSSACSNPETKAGYAGYCVRSPLLIGHAKFYSVQIGPASTGLAWMVNCTDISITPYTYTEAFTGDSAVLAHDNLKLEFQAHLVFLVKRDETSIRGFMEQYSFIGKSEEEKKKDPVENVYVNYLKEPFRTYVRDEVQQRNGLDVKDQLMPIGAAVDRRLRAYATNSPFELSNIVIGNIQYPTAVANAVALKIQTIQDLARQDTEIAITQKAAEKRRVEASGIAAAMDLIQAKLTNQYLQHEAIEAQKMQVNSPNHTVVYIPVGANGVPITEAGRAIASAK